MPKEKKWFADSVLFCKMSLRLYRVVQGTMFTRNKSHARGSTVSPSHASAHLLDAHVRIEPVVPAAPPLVVVGAFFWHRHVTVVR